MRFVGAATALVLMVGCGVGGDDGGNHGTDAGSDLNGELCSASLTTTGTFTAGTPARPTDPDTGMPITGCWPVGTWTFTAKVSDMGGCKTAPMLAQSYSFRVDRMDPDGSGYVESYALLAGTDGMQTHIAVSAVGDGCQAHLELGSMDGTQYWNLQPHLLDTATALDGKGDYVVYKANGWPWQ